MLKPSGRRWSALTIILFLSISCGGFGREATPKSIILIIADGTGVGQYTLSYYHNDRFSPAAFEHVGLMTTHPSTRNKVTDSASAATAYSTGVKTYNGAIGVDDDRQPLKTVLEYAQDQGMATGLVATSTITHATPAAFAAHVPSRDDHNEIARQLAVAGVTVIFGGGRQYFHSRDNGGEQEVDLLVTMVARDIQIINHLSESIDPSRPVVGLFAMDSLPPANQGREPSTTAMALRALEILDDDPDGFFLMVEESQVDWASHANEADRTLAEMASLNDLIDALLAYQLSHPEVLVVLVADHETGGLGVKNAADGGGLDAGWIHGDHTANMVPIFATGPGGEVFDAVVDNIFIGQTLIDYVNSR